MSSPKDELTASLRSAIQKASPATRAQGLSQSPLDFPGSKEPFDMTQTEFAKKMNRFLESASDGAQQLMDYVNLSNDWAIASPTFTISESINPGDTYIYINLPDSNLDQEWVLEEERNRLGIVDPGTKIALSTIYLEYSQRDARGRSVIRLALENPVSKNFIRNYYEQAFGDAPEDGVFTIPKGTSVARFERVRNDNFSNQAIDVMLTHVDSGLDQLELAVDTVIGKDQIEIACCVLRQLAAIANAGSIIRSASEAVVPSEKAQKALQEIREFVVKARIIATFSMTTQGFSLNFMKINIYAIIIDSMLVSLSTTLNVVYRNVKDTIYNLAFGLLRRNKIINCMPFYDLIKGLLAWLYSREGMLGWLAGLLFQSVTRMKAFFQDDIAGLSMGLKKQINFERLLHLLDSIIAATSNMELCQDLVHQYNDDITKETATLEVDESQATEDSNTEDSNTNNPDFPSYLNEYNDVDSTLDSIFRPATGSEDISVNDLEMTGAEALGLILQPSDNEIEQFMINRLGADPTVARDAVYRSKMGECGRGLDPSELSNVIEALQTAGLEL